MKELSSSIEGDRSGSVLSPVGLFLPVPFNFKGLQDRIRSFSQLSFLPRKKVSLAILVQRDL